MLDLLARKAAQNYKRKCWWVSRDDLVQVAWIAALEAQRTYDERLGVPFERYAWRAMINKLHGAVLRESAPVSAPYRKLLDLRGLYRAALADNLVSASLPPDEVLARLQHEARMVSAVRSVAGAGAVAEVALDVLLREKRSAQVAQERMLPVSVVYAAARMLKRRLKRSHDALAALHDLEE